MNVSNNFKIKRTGIGDLIFFCTEIIYSDINNFKISICDINIKTYKNEEYRNFCFEFIKKILWNKNFEITSDQNYPVYTENWDLINLAIDSNKINEHFINVFDKKLNFDQNDYIVILTKSRAFSKKTFNTISNQFFKEINKLNKKIILLGEKEIEYGPEYIHHGPENIYSIYYDCLNRINPELLVDKTIEKLGITNPKLDNLLYDMNIILNSNKIITFGCGGFFCTSLVIKKLCSLIQGDKTCNLFPNQINKQVFFEFDKFINTLKNDTNL